MNERELLYKVLFDMKRDIAELKHQMAAATGGNPMPASSAIVPATNIMSYSEHHDIRPEAEEQEAEEVKEVKNVPLRMEDAEEVMIRKALERHAGNRKEAAAELGISERTLYRKLKSIE